MEWGSKRERAIRQGRLEPTAEEDEELIKTLRKTIRAMRMAGEEVHILKPKKEKG